MPKRKAFSPRDLEIVGRATHEEIVTGDFVRLGSGSPLGLVSDVTGETATGTWLTEDFPRFSLPWLCLRQERKHGADHRKARKG